SARLVVRMLGNLLGFSFGSPDFFGALLRSKSFSTGCQTSFCRRKPLFLRPKQFSAIGLLGERKQ
ncbi:hypothetical protein, partial [Roseibium sp. RKSG952]|uniref:hypothetical protein n=1 Tax=Roseibium sp. RKSG952 TaxID=2529384 RepID=UPI001AD8DB40